MGRKGDEQLIVGIDLGSTAIRVAVGQMLTQGDQRSLHLLGMVETPSEGIHKGMITSIEDAVSSVSSCIEKAERAVGSPIERVWVGINGHEISTTGSKGVVAVARPNGEITVDDVARVIEASKTVAMPANYEILHVIPRSFTVDGSNPVKDPVGMSGVRLEVDALIVQIASSHKRNLSRTIYRTSLDINDMVLSILAAAEVSTTQRSRDMGVAIIDIGGSTTSVLVMEGGDVIHGAFIPIGSAHITADIALGLRIPIEVAERIKVNEGTASLKGLSKRDELLLSDFGSQEQERVPRKYIAEIVEARVEELFEKIDNELRAISRDGVLPAGVVCIGGGSKLNGLLEVSKRKLRLPSALGFPIGVTSVSDKINDVGFASVTGLVRWGADIMAAQTPSRWSGLSRGFQATGKAAENIKKWMKSLLP